MTRKTKRPALVLVALLAAGAIGCTAGPAGSGTFEKTLSVNGPVRLELQTGAGKARITAGPAATVHIQGTFRLRGWSWENAQRRVAEATKSPPIEQDRNLIRVGFHGPHDIEVDYTIEVPAETEMRATGGSSDLDVSGVRGPVTLTTGSGQITAEQITGDVHVTTGSGEVRLADIQGRAEISTGSGDLKLSRMRGEIRIGTGSGDIRIDQPGATVTAKTGSGDVHLAEASGDVRVRTGSGDVTVDGIPSSGAYWELQTSSGNVTLHVPPSASFRFHAHSKSNRIQCDVPLVVEEQSRHEWRARLGEGSARVEVQTTSGEIHLE